MTCYNKETLEVYMQAKTKDTLLMMSGATLLAFALYNVHRVNHITEGGILGMVLFLDHWFHISGAISGFVMDMSCYLLGWKIFGFDFIKKAILSSITFSVSYGIFEQFDPIFPPMHPLLAAIVGGVLVGIGVGLVVRNKGAAGGDDALAQIIQYFTKKDLAYCYLFTDLTVLALSLTYIPFMNIFYSLITVTISSFIIGKIQISEQ